jgi:hypothetical protein
VNVAPLPALTVAPGNGRVNAAALDAQFRAVAAKINALIRALGVARGTANSLAPGSVPWRAFALTARRYLTELAQQLAALRRQALTPYTPWNATDFRDPFPYQRLATVPPAPLYFGFTPINPRTIRWPLVIPGDPARLYRIKIRIRHYSERCNVGDASTRPAPPGGVGDPGNPELPSFQRGRVAATLPSGAINPDANKVYGTGLGWDGGSVAPFGITTQPVPLDVQFDITQGVCHGQRAPLVVPAAGSGNLWIQCSNPFRSWVLNALYQTNTSGMAPNQAQQQSLWTCRPLDTILDFTVQGGSEMEVIASNIGGVYTFTALTDGPADDDPRFPYLAKYRAGAKFQWDVLVFRPYGLYPDRLSTEYDAALQTEAGVDILVA